MQHKTISSYIRAENISLLTNQYIKYLSLPVPESTNKIPIARHYRNYENYRNARCKESFKDLTTLPLEDIHVWSDLHFGHAKVIEYCDRPFDDVESMNELLLYQHNQVVKPNDVVIWGGDIGFKSTEDVNDILDKCNGYKILIIGNHDFKKRDLRDLHVDEIHVTYDVVLDDVPLVFTHYPWKTIPDPYVNIHGHVHNRFQPETKLINMSCEVLDYEPRNIKWFTTIAKSRLQELKNQL